MCAATVKEAGSSLVSHCASAAANFIGCDCTMYCACKWPVNKTEKDVMAPTVTAILNDFLNISTSCLRKIFHALIPVTRIAPVVKAVNRTCRNYDQKYSLVKISPILFICA